jgi:hypothetical protein
MSDRRARFHVSPVCRHSRTSLFIHSAQVFWVDDDGGKETTDNSDIEDTQHRYSMEDVKPRVGFIPRSEPLRPSAPGKHNFFKVELLVGDSKKLMLPFAQKTVSSELSLDHYIATPDLPFSIRVKIAKPRSEGLLYGARVYIDSGRTENYVYNVNSNTQEHVDEGDKVIREKAEFDHFFWIGAGETEYTIEGFFKSSSQSHQFVFGEPARKRARADINVVSEVLHSVGKIRIAFSHVEGFTEGSSQSVAAPQGKSMSTLLDQKVVLVSQPGKVVVDRVARGHRLAILSNEVIFEKRLIYNSFEGYKRTDGQLLNSHLYNVDFYKGMPLSLLLYTNVRKMGIMTFLRNVTNSRFHNFCMKKLDQVSTSAIQVAVVAPSDTTTNTYVRVEDVVHFICDSLSSAASFILCTGKEKTGNYGEEIVQRQGCSPEVLDYSLKERGLVSFFQAEPGFYDLELVDIDVSRDSHELPNKNYKVRLCVVDLLEDSDDDE